MIPLPKKIENCPIIEAVFEIRYSSESPVDAIFGILYASIKDFFTEKPVSLPILQLPESVREQDPNLKYHAYHKLVNGNFVLDIGPRVLTFRNIPPYEGWTQWSKFFYSVLGSIEQTKVLDIIERIGLRYVNLFNGNIFNKVKVDVNIDNKTITDASTNIKTEILDEKFIKILQVGNSVNMVKDGKMINGSIIDIDCLYNVSGSLNFFDNYHEIIEDAHNKEKELFFSLLEDSFLQELKPQYGE